MEALWAGIDNLASWPVLAAILIGSVGGLAIGAVPGIGPAIAIAILLPATVFLDDLVSLVLLLGVYGSSMYGGAIPAILINTPGTPVNAQLLPGGSGRTRHRSSAR
ncbi:MAG: tripartite tricarboxylate transporter permease, partial [Pseudomonadota bacterium]